jgi:hypothetical protein
MQSDFEASESGSGVDRHHRLVEEIAQRVEERLAAKFARWVGFNVMVLLGTISGAIGAYYAIDNRLSEQTRINIIQDKMLEQVRSEEIATRSELLQEMRYLRTSQDDLMRYVVGRPRLNADK